MGRNSTHKLPFIFGVVTFSILVASIVVGTANAAWGRGLGCGYFYNVCGGYGYRPYGWTVGQTGSLFQGGVPAGVNSVDSLIGWLQGEYNSGQPNQNMAAFVVRTMQGQGGGASPSLSAADWSDLKARLTQPSVSINWNAYHSTGYNTYQQSTSMTPTTYRPTSRNDVAWITQGQSGQAIMIYYNGSPVYALFRSCGNPDGGLPGIPAAPAPNPAPVGYYDSLSCVYAQGWAFDPSVSSQSIRVDVQVDGTTRIWQTTNVYRPDVNAAFGISGTHGFQDDISAWVSDGGTHTVEPFAIDIDSSGNTTGTIVSLGKRTVSGCYLPTGYYDSLSCMYAQGWAFDRSVPSQSIRVDVQVDGITRIWQTTNVYRPDVNAAFGITGNHGFQDDISAWVSDGGTHTVEPFAIDIDSSGNTTGLIVSLGKRTVSGCYNYTLTPSVSSPGGAYIEAGDALNFQYQVKNSGPTTSPVVADAIKQYLIPPGQSLNTYTMQDNVTANCNNVFSSTLCATSWQLPSRSFGVGTTSVDTTGSSPAYTPTNTAGLPIGTSICQILALDPAGQDTNGNIIHGRWSAPFCVRIVAKPYFTVTGGDISSDGNITSWNADNVGGAGYAGAGSQLAALATGNITSFVTGTGMSSNPSSLAFANTTAAGTRYGGGYTETTPMPVISTAGATVLTTSTPSLSSLNGTYTRSGDLTLWDPTPAGKSVTIVMTSGNLYISNNISYSYGSLAQIPRLTVIVQNGNIYVNNNVSQIHGVFYVGGAGQGNFYSCATGIGAPSTDYNTCNHQLTVYGAVTANKLILSRTYGSVHATTGTPAAPAENFFYSPEVWLAPASSTSSNSSDVIYNSYVSLPPIL